MAQLSCNFTLKLYSLCTYIKQFYTWRFKSSGLLQALGSSEMCVTTYHLLWQNIPEALIFSIIAVTTPYITVIYLHM